jgi:hypothetical protein
MKYGIEWRILNPRSTQILTFNTESPNVGNPKFTIPFNGSMALSNQLFDSEDQVVEAVIPFLSKHREHITEVLSDAQRFSDQSF